MKTGIPKNTTSSVVKSGFAWLLGLALTVGSGAFAAGKADADSAATILVQWQPYMQTAEFQDLLERTVLPTRIPRAEVKSYLKDRCALELDDAPKEAEQASPACRKASGPKSDSDSRSKFLEQLLEANEAQDTAALVNGEGTVIVPACVPESRPVQVVLRRNDIPEDLAARYFGYAGCKTLNRFKDLNKEGGDTIDFKNLQPGQKIWVPFLKSWSRLTLKPGTSADAFLAEAAAITGHGESGTVPESDALTVYADSPPVTLGDASEENPGEDVAPDLTTANRSCSNEAVSDIVGFDVLSTILQLNDRIIREAGVARQTMFPTSVAVIDVGFDLRLIDADGSPFLNWVGQTNARFTSLNDAAGGKAIRLLGLEPQSALHYLADHGIGTVFIAGGGNAVIEGDASALPRLREAFVVWPFGILKDDDAAVESFSTPLDLASNITTLAGSKTSIINLSLASKAHAITDSTYASWNKMMLELGNVLIVAAAGNAAKNVEGSDADADPSPMYLPAAFGGKGRFGNKVMTVAALNGRDKAGFSNWSSTNVDIFAPGCNIVTRGANMKKKSQSGTSDAAPIVTFVAALIEFFGSPDGPRVKDRILESARFRSSLEPYAVRGAVLDPVAVAVYTDAVNFSSNPEETSYQFGLVQTPKRTIAEKICSADELKRISNVAGIRRIHRLPAAPNNRFLILYQDKAGTLNETSCSGSEVGSDFKVRFLTDVTGPADTTPLLADSEPEFSSISDIVYRMPDTVVDGVLALHSKKPTAYIQALWPN